MMKTPKHCGANMWKDSLAESGNQRWRCKVCRMRTTRPPEGDAIEDDDNLGYDPAATKAYGQAVIAGLKSGKYERVVVSCAQSNTRTAPGFVKTLQTYCKHNRAALVFMPARYKNLSLYSGSQRYDVWYDDLVSPYLVTDELYLGGNVVLRADIRLSVTSANPLSGKESINGTRWTVFAHPQFAMEPVASPGDMLPKRMYTTGAATKTNYSRTDVGAKAERHHVIGALVIEPMVPKHAFIRHLNFDSKRGFYDLDKYYSEDKVRLNKPCAAVVPGDEHVAFNLPAVRKAVYDAPGSMVNRLKPKYVVRHDVLDGYAGSHHHDKDDVLLFSKHHSGMNNYRRELDQVVDFINATTPKGCTTLIVPSNHHDHLYQWLSKVDPKKDPTNALLIHELKKQQYEDVLKGGDGDPFKLYLTPRLTCAFKLLNRSKHFAIKGIGVDQHGDVGANGSRGSAKGLARTTYKLMIGHSHGARIVKGVTQVGTSTGRREYERGLGDHTNTVGIIYNNGKRALFDIIKGRYHK